MEHTPRHVIFASYGNDSVALIQWAHERDLQGVVVAHSDTGWASDEWPARVREAERWVESLGFCAVRIPSEGMEALIERKKAWPRGGGGTFQFCTKALKEEPAHRWLEANDPDASAICLIGVRRCESRNRATAPEWVEESARHGGRSLWSPLVRHTDAMRNELIARTPFDVLPHRSRECFPCVNANRSDLVSLTPERIAHIRALEERMGVNSKGNARVMFSPARCQGQVGIDAVVKWANGTHTGQESLFDGAGCESGWCGG